MNQRVPSQYCTETMSVASTVRYDELEAIVVSGQSLKYRNGSSVSFFFFGQVFLLCSNRQS
jgi:hypothetical protein